MQSLFELDGTAHWVSLARSADGWALAWEGGHSAVACESHDGVRGQVIVDGQAHPVAFIRDGDTVHIQLDGRAYALRSIDPVNHFAAPEATARHDVSRAPMPGVVLSVAVKAGEHVAAGATLMTIESMKLETAIRASRDGLVETIHVTAGQMFERDAALVTLVKGEA